MQAKNNNETYHGISIDEFVEKLWEMKSDAKGGHYIAFKGTRHESLGKLIYAFTSLLQQELQETNEYGYPISRLSGDKEDSSDDQEDGSQELDS